MLRIQTLSSQPVSAQAMVANANIKHGDIYAARMIIGVSPADHIAKQLAHFCPGRLLGIRKLSDGDGRPVPIDETYAVRIERGLPPVSEFGFLCFDALIHPNGALTFTPQGKQMLFVPIRGDILETTPFARDWGAEDLADDFGCRTIADMVQRHGQPLTV